jgi:Integrase core domain
MRDELLNESLFLGLDHARTKITNWVDDYNQRRPDSALGYLTPAAYGANLSAPWQALSSATSLWRLRSYVRPVDASRNPLAMMISASSGFSSAPRARSAGRGTECPGRRFAGSPSPHCALAKLLSPVPQEIFD